tara:strand:- start:187 stop:1929 length:1743 start_codon:yes stop_codon:yes gene_type:complete
MAISPQDYSLWSRMTGNRYPKTAREKAAVGPDVKKFVNNVAKQGAQGGKSEEKKEKVNITGKQIATGALGVGLVAGAVAAARRKGTRDAVTSFLSNLGDKSSTKTYTRPNQGDITPPPVQQQTSTATGMGSLSEKAYSSLQEQQKVTPLSQETPAFAAFKPADNTKPAPGTILGKDLSPEEKQKALAQAKLQEFYAGKYGVDKSGVRSARYEIEKQTSQKEPVVASQPSAENDEFYTRDELNTMGKIDKLVESIKTGNRPQQPRAVATDVKNTALLQSADNKTPKVNKIIGEPTLKSKLDTKMAVHEETRVANTINEYKGEFDNTYGKVLNQITQGNVSGANDRDKRRAERLTNKVLNKNNPGLVRRFHGAVKQDVSMKTAVNPEDASRIAESVINPTTGTRQFDEETSKTIKREPFKETVVEGEPKSGGGRKVSAYGPGYASKSTIGVYGLERANYPEADPTKKPTELTKERGLDRKAGGITTKQDIRGLKDEALDRVIDQGTFKSGKQGSSAKIAQGEKERRQTRAKLGSDFTFEAMRGLQNIERNVAPDQRPDARKKYIEELKQERDVRKGVSDVFD